MNLFMFTILRPVSQYTIISGVRQKQKQKHFAYTLANTWNLDVSKYPDVWFHTDLTTECLLFFFLSAVGAQHSQWIPQCRPQWIYHSRANLFFLFKQLWNAAIPEPRRALEVKHKKYFSLIVDCKNYSTSGKQIYNDKPLIVIFKLVYELVYYSWQNIFLLWRSSCPFPFGSYFWDKAIINKPFGIRKKEDGSSWAESLILILSKHILTQWRAPGWSGSISLILTKISMKRLKTFLFCVVSILNIFNPIVLLCCHNSAIINHMSFHYL